MSAFVLVNAMDEKMQATYLVQENGRKGELEAINGVWKYINRLKNDRNFSQRVVLSIMIYITSGVVGGIKSQSGPALLDLRNIAGVDLETGSWIATSVFLGHLTGALIGGFLYQRTSPTALICWCLLGSTVFVAAVPWCSIFALMVTVHLLLGVMFGMLECVSTSILFEIWRKSDGPAIVALHLTYYIGALISPLYISSFLTETTKTTSTTTHTHNKNNSEFAQTSTIINDDQNQDYSLENTSIRSNCTEFEICQENKRSRLTSAYLITASICAMMAIGFIMFHTYQSKIKSHNKAGRTTELRPQNQGIKHLDHLKIISLAVLVCLFTMSLAVDINFGIYLTTFCVEELGWTKSEGSLLTSVLYMATVAGGITGVAITRYINTNRYLGSQCVMLTASLVLFFVGAQHDWNEVIWIAVTLFGCSKSIILPLILSWTNATVVPVSGHITSVYVTVSFSGNAINSVGLGMLMEQFSRFWFCYLLFIEAILIIVLFTVAVLLTGHVQRKYGIYIIEEVAPTEDIVVDETIEDVDLQNNQAIIGVDMILETYTTCIK